MNRDALIAEEERKQCSHVGCKFIVNDGSISIDELTKGVLMQFLHGRLRWGKREKNMLVIVCYVTVSL